eukprot:CAMPEP_0197562688 /NCGR_PEP_ID=MMETSP1320-20131121/27346_1 /TAXON_ID=91990 /ORGANISM="Bolidomonas sp., Strain RCC2347" /LENGTH=63 /DNA_ID=CAMNT_0043124439 /DNA_START=98 /DNA_END=286 /DNA_ORIENTATION=+
MDLKFKQFQYAEELRQVALPTVLSNDDHPLLGMIQNSAEGGGEEAKPKNVEAEEDQQDPKEED